MLGETGDEKLCAGHKAIHSYVNSYQGALVQEKLPFHLLQKA